MTEAAKTAEADASVATETTSKSIVDPKYRNKYKNRSEWMADLLKANCSVTKTIAAVPAKGEEGKEGYVAAKPERTVVEGVDVEKCFAVARENGLNVDKYEAQRDGHGFPGRFRMTVGNMLRATAKARHGVKINGTWHDAPAEWLTANEAPAEATHDHDGVKIAKAVEAKPEAESKLIKAADAPAKPAAAPVKAPAKATAKAK